MADIFLSYSREDHARAEQIAKALTAAGYEVFWDVEIPPGKSWADVLEEKLGICKAAIVLWSRISTASKWVREEARLAHDRGKLIPVQIDEAPPPFGFGEIQAADLKQWRGDTSDPHWRALLSAVSAAVQRPPSAPSLTTSTVARATPATALKNTAISTIGSWLAPAMRGYVIAAIGIVALLGAVALRYMPAPAPSDHTGEVDPGASPAARDDGAPANEDAGGSPASGSGTAASDPGSVGTVAPPPGPPPPPTSDTAASSTGVTRQEILDYLNAHGYAAKLAIDPNNASIVKTSVDGVIFNVYFFNCRGERCPEIEFSAGWQMQTSPPLSLLNDWNKSKRLARAYTNEKGDGLFIEMDADLTNASSLGEIDEYLRLWKTLLGNFKKQFSL